MKFKYQKFVLGGDAARSLISWPYLPIRRHRQSDLLAPIISSRDIVDALKAIIRESREATIVLDFIDVEAISRSAAHEVLVIRDELAPLKTIEIANTNPAVNELFRVTAADKVVPKKDKPSFEATRTTLEELLEEMVI